LVVDVTTVVVAEAEGASGFRESSDRSFSTTFFRGFVTVLLLQAHSDHS
jgi:hypothetical protein